MSEGRLNKKISMCLKCGERSCMMQGNIKFNACSVCGEKLSKVDFLLHQYLWLDEQGKQATLERLREQFVRTSPVYDPEMEEVRKAIERGEHVPPRLVKCPVCEGKTSSSATNCPHCGQAIAALMKDTQASSSVAQSNVPKCPNCSSVYIKQLTPLDRGVSTFVWGRASNKFNKSFECRNCGYTW